jgi:hypothetical protein
VSLTDRLLGDRQRLAYIASQAADSRLNVELETEGMTLNIGPQHPATHGTLRIIARLDGEQVVWAEPSCGYMHRGYEKLAEVRTYPQVTSLVNRIDWLGSFANEVPFILAAEKLMGVEAPARSQHIRTILFELSRIANVSLFLGDLGVQMGAITPVFFAFRDREYVLNLIEGATGGRFHPNFDRIGGLKDDLPKGWIAETKAVMKKLRTFCDQIDDLLFGNEIFQARMRGIGVIPRDVALQYGLSGAEPAAWIGTCVVIRVCRWLGIKPIGKSGHTPMATASRVVGYVCRKRASQPRLSTSCSTPSPVAQSWPRSPRSSKCPKARHGYQPKTHSARWVTTSCHVVSLAHFG